MVETQIQGPKNCHLPTDLSPNFSVPTSVKAKPLLFSIYFQQIGRFTVSDPNGKALETGKDLGPPIPESVSDKTTEIFYQEIRLNVTSF